MIPTRGIYSDVGRFGDPRYLSIASSRHVPIGEQSDPSFLPGTYWEKIRPVSGVFPIDPWELPTDSAARLAMLGF
jgi:hypothetical protein